MRFDLSTEPCVPVIDVQGFLQTFGLRDTLIRAHQLQEVSHYRPITTASLIRLLVAILADVYALPNHSSWGRVWAQGRFDEEKVIAYFEKYADRFDLFHPWYPFYQCAALEDAKPVNLNRLACELSSGNNPTLFDHTMDENERDYSPAEAFQLLITIQNFALPGLLKRTTRLRDESEVIYWGNGCGGVLIPGAVVWLAGNNLFETL
ncbi:MAG: type I-E CRISPR-associated protein Cse1/CasA, partial [Candidatus Hadarchaeum sp.]